MFNDADPGGPSTSIAVVPTTPGIERTTIAAATTAATVVGVAISVVCVSTVLIIIRWKRRGRNSKGHIQGE